MGMFDSFYFEAGVLPNNKMPPTCEFQTKELECELTNYTVDTTGRLYRSTFCYETQERTFPEPVKLTQTITVYSYEFSNNIPTRRQEYELAFEDGWLMKATKTDESGFEEYSAALMQSFSP